MVPLSSPQPLLEVRALHVHFRADRPHEQPHHVLCGIDMTVAQGEMVGIIGETGSGKTTLARSIVGLVAPASGSVLLEGRPISGLSGRERRKVRRDGKVQFVFQDPLRALDPSVTIWKSVSEGLAIRGRTSVDERRNAAASALKTVGLDRRLLDRRPGEISGGQRQRVTLARALAMAPRLMLCDEPVSAVDAANRTYVLQTLDRLRNDLGLAIVIISHDLSSMVGFVDRVLVLHEGRIVEQGDTGRIFTDPQNPYTQMLVDAAPQVMRQRARALLDKRERGC